jgi:hypothetical protein
LFCVRFLLPSFAFLLPFCLYRLVPVSIFMYEQSS